MKTLDNLKKEYGLKIDRDDKNKDITFITFKDGKKYKLQAPTFFELHDAITKESPDTELLRLGIKHLFPENEKSPAINESYLNHNKNEAFSIWSPLIRGLLSRF